MRYYCNPINMEYKYQMVKNPRSGSDKAVIYREAADPSLVLFKGLYYLFPSMTAGFLTSEDLVSWMYHKFLSDMPVCDYAPDVRQVGDYLYFCASSFDKNCSFYRSKNPLIEPFEEIPGTFPFWDPNLFHDDDGRLYLYWGCSNMTPIYGVELDRETMKPLTEPLVMFDSDDSARGYERFGEDHIPPKTPEEVEAAAQKMIAEMMRIPEEMRKASKYGTEDAIRKLAYGVCGNAPYIEGAWMTKHGGKYYLQYAIPGTQYNVYGDGVYIADAPLGPYRPAKNNPLSYKPGGFIIGAGHGSTLEDKRGNQWHTSTMSVSVNADFERRLGLWKAGFDSDGEMFCGQRYGDWPTNLEAPAFAKPDFMLLSYGKPVKVSAGTGAENVTDENVRTWWQGEGPGGTLEVDLQQVYDVHAVQINFADFKMETEMAEDRGVKSQHNGQRDIIMDAGKTRWLLQGSADGNEYFIICDKSEAKTDLSHDLILQERGILARYIKLTIFETPYSPSCVSGIRVFGKADGKLPKPVEQFTLSRARDLDMDVEWESVNATGYNILWGYSPDKLYHSCMVFGKTKRGIGALVKGEPVFVRVDAFNESGITEGTVQKL